MRLMKKHAKKLLRRGKASGATENVDVLGEISLRDDILLITVPGSGEATTGSHMPPPRRLIDNSDELRIEEGPADREGGTADIPPPGESSGSHEMSHSEPADLRPDEPDTFTDEHNSATFDLPLPDTNLWEKAYKEVEEDDEFSSYLRAFRKYLKQQASSHHSTATTPGDASQNPGPKSETREEVQTWVKQKLDGLASNKLKFAIGDRQIVVRQKLEKLVTFIDRHKAIVTAAAKAEPKAALAWGGCMAILSLLVNFFQQPKDALEGFEQVCRLLVTGQLVEDSLCRNIAG